MDSTTLIKSYSGFPETILKRNKELQELRKKKEEFQQPTPEKLQFYLVEYSKLCSEIENIFGSENLKDLQENEIKTFLESIKKKLEGLKTFIAESSIYLRLYDIRKANEDINLFNERLKELEGKFEPKKKFSFKNKSLTNSTMNNIKQNSSDKIDGVKSHKLPTNDGTYAHRFGEIIILQRGEINNKDLVFTDIDNCTIKIYGSPSSLCITRIKNSIILSGPVKTSTFIEQSSNSTFQIACQQLRIHDSHLSTFYLYISSRTIMEDSSDISISSYNWNYDFKEEDFNLCSFGSQNNWLEVDDFNWLAQDSHSPNWTLLEKEKWQTKWD